ncbi:MAG: hypothetical protein ACYS99_13215, partial [Planctomycetota bacterium]
MSRSLALRTCGTFLIVLALVTAAPTEAAEILVTTLQDSILADGQVGLHEAIDAANLDISIDGSAAGSGADVIRFAPGLAGGTMSARFVGDTTFGPSSFFIYTEITIEGDETAGITIEREAGTDEMRLFYVSSQGSLTLRNLTLAGGLAQGGNGGVGKQRGAGGGGAAGLGGAIFNEGSLTLDSCTLYGNVAQGGDGGPRS